MNITYRVQDLESKLESVRSSLRRNYEDFDLGEFVSTGGGRQEIFESRSNPRDEMIMYYPQKFDAALGNCLDILKYQRENRYLKNVGFCLDFATEAFEAYLHMEVTFALLKRLSVEEKYPLFLDHVLHIMNVYLVGKQLLAQRSAGIMDRRGYHLLFQRIKDSDIGKACAELLGKRAEDLANLREDISELSSEDPSQLTQEEELIWKAWLVASYCHDIGYILSFTCRMELGKQGKTLKSGAEPFESSWRFLFSAFKKGIDAFRGSAPRPNSHVEGVLLDLYEELKTEKDNFEKKGEIALVDHGKASASLLMNRFAAEVQREKEEGSYMSQVDKAALFLAICAVFRHTAIAKDITEEEYDSNSKGAVGMHKEQIWRWDPLAAFLSMVDSLQDFVARVGWYVGKPEEVDFRGGVQKLNDPEKRDSAIKNLTDMLEEVSDRITQEDRNALKKSWIPDGDLESFAKDLKNRLRTNFNNTMDILEDNDFAHLIESYLEKVRATKLVQVPINGFVPIQGMRIHDNGIEWIDAVQELIYQPDKKKKVWNPRTTPTEPKRKYLAMALKIFGLVKERFNIPSCADCI